MRPRWEVCREFALALTDLVLGIPRQAFSLLARKRRLAEFEGLQHDPLPQAASLPAARDRPLRVVLSCGDASGEAHAVRLLRELRQIYPQLEVHGFGGAALEAEGMRVWEPLADLNVMGFRDVVAQLPLFFGCVRRFAEELRDQPPDLVVLLDYPGLNRHLLRVARRAGVPVVDYIAPQLWAWAPWRVRDFRRADRLLTILPFESDWYARHGARATYVGHPLGDGLESAAANEAELPAALRDVDRSEAEPKSEVDPRSEADPKAPSGLPSKDEAATAPPGGAPRQAPPVWVGILPGSRKREILENLPVLLRAAQILQERRPEVRFVLPHLRTKVDALLREMLAEAPVEVVYAPGCFHRALPGLRAAWVASGTALLEVAAYRVPPVLVYQVSSRLGAWLSRHWLAVPAVGSLNLIAGRELAPEHLGRQLDPQALAEDLERRLDGPVREQTLEAIESLRPAFAEPGAARRTAALLAEIVE